MTSDNREAWLQKAADKMRPWFPGKVPEFRVSVGWPGGKGKKGSTIGQAWSRKATEDGIPQVFISPVLSDPVEVLATLLHEMAHVLDDNENGHKKPFADIAAHVGLVKPWTATTPSEELRLKLGKLVRELGVYPHGALNKGVARSPHTQTTRMLKAECPNQTGYKVRMTQKWLDEYGAPYCACCNQQMEID